MNRTFNANPAAGSPLPETDAAAWRMAPVMSTEILQGRNEICIAHGGCVYTLRVTRQGKLILTK